MALIHHVYVDFSYNKINMNNSSEHARTLTLLTLIELLMNKKC